MMREASAVGKEFHELKYQKNDRVCPVRGLVGVILDLLRYTFPAKTINVSGEVVAGYLQYHVPVIAFAYACLAMSRSILPEVWNKQAML